VCHHRHAAQNPKREKSTKEKESLRCNTYHFQTDLVQRDREQEFLVSTTVILAEFDYRSKVTAFVG
jgi:hypothetical protein